MRWKATSLTHSYKPHSKTIVGNMTVDKWQRRKIRNQVIKRAGRANKGHLTTRNFREAEARRMVDIAVKREKEKQYQEIAKNIEG